MAVTTNLTVGSGQAVVFTASALAATAISGWTFAFTVYDVLGNAKSQVTTAGGGIVTTDAVNGIMTITLTSAETDFPAGRYFWDLWRVDAGFQDRLAFGSFYIDRSSFQTNTPP